MMVTGNTAGVFLMRPRRKKPNRAKQAEILADIRRRQVEREQGYREKALAMFPHVCGRCGRDFSGKNLRELTVHHKDHDHHHNPPDGSNWELLCVYCHDDEHQKSLSTGYHGTNAAPRTQEAPLSHRAFEGLQQRLESDHDSES